MKKFLISLSYLWLLTVLGCNQNEFEEQISPQVPAVVQYQGLEVVFPENMPQEAFNPSLTNFSVRVQKLFDVNFSNARVSGDVSKEEQDISEILQMLAEEKVKTPDLSKYPLHSADLNRIKKDFPSIKNEQDVRKHQDAVFGYYNDIVRETVLQRYLKKTKTARSQNLVVFLTSGPLILALWVGWPYVWIKQAQQDADHRVLNDVVGGRFGGTPGIDWNIANLNDYKNNAYRHSLWNALGMKYMIDAGVSKNSAVDLMQDVATSYEAAVGNWQLFWNTAHFPGNNPNQIFHWVDVQSVTSAMDLNNNLVGRTYVYKNIGWGIFGLFRNLSYTDICDHLRNMAENAQYYSGNAAGIHQQYGNDPDGFERLKLWTYDDTDRSLIYIKQ